MTDYKRMIKRYANLAKSMQPSLGDLEKFQTSVEKIEEVTQAIEAGHITEQEGDAILAIEYGRCKANFMVLVDECSIK